LLRTIAAHLETHRRNAQPVAPAVAPASLAPASAPSLPTASDSAPATTNAPKQVPLVSTFAGDADMADVLVQFVQGLPTRVAEMEQQLHAGDLETLRRTVHQLKGAGGGYGFDPITTQAALAEQQIKDGKAIEQISQEVESLAALVRRVVGYDSARESSAGHSADQSTGAQQR
jgi:HPt (histidine-containing phosphotransfer) domain-containing protein